MVTVSPTVPAQTPEEIAREIVRDLANAIHRDMFGRDAPTHFTGMVASYAAVPISDAIRARSDSLAGRVKALTEELAWEQREHQMWLETATYEVGAAPRLWRDRARDAEARLSTARREAELAGIERAAKVAQDKAWASLVRYDNEPDEMTKRLFGVAAQTANDIVSRIRALQSAEPAP